MREANYTFKNRVEAEEMGSVLGAGRGSEYNGNQGNNGHQHHASTTPYLSNAKTDGRQKWFQYLPTDNPQLLQHSTLSKEEPRGDSYLHSLQRRLEKLFKQEKEMLRERHYNRNEEVVSNHSIKDRRSVTNYQLNNSKDGVYNIDHMQRKVRELEQRYLMQEHGKAEKQQQREKEAPQQRIIRHHSNSKQQSHSGSKQPQQTHYSPSNAKDLLTQSVQQCLSKERQLQEEVQDLKQSVKQLRENNEHLLKRIQHRQQRKKHKHRTKELLRSILIKLEFINLEIKTAKKRQAKGQGKLGKVEKEANQLVQQFQALRLQYKHLEEERKRVEKKQEEIQNKISRIDKKVDTQ